MEWRQCLTNYEVSDTGLVRNKKTKQILTATPNSSGYLRVQTWDEVKHIRQVYVPHSRQYGTRALARIYGVTPGLISRIVNNKIWKRRDDLS